VETAVARLLSKDPVLRPHSADEVAVLLRALAPVADSVPADEGPEASHDPTPVVGLFDEPETTPPPQMLPRPDPGLERAMMGHVEAPPVQEKTPSAPPRAPPALRALRWLAAVAVVLAGAVLALRRTPAPSPPRAETTAGAPAAAPVPAPAPVAPPAPAAAPVPAAPPATAVAPAPAAPETTAATPAPAAPSAYGKIFDRAQKALWTNDASLARDLLTPLLKKRDLSRRDRARTMKMLGDSEAKAGNKSKAARWYRKSLTYWDDPQERAKVERLIGSK
jgi:hypothetical protein